jgi:L-2,4-diaminobutyric acid acetyltransferase
MTINQLVAISPPLDTNSAYCNLLQCSHFADTSVIAKESDQCLGFVSGYLIPARPDTLFVWQVVVSEAARGRGLASQLLEQLLERPACQQVRYVETTITEDNAASWALFRKLANHLTAELSEAVGFDKETHFHGAHASEHLLRIGPFQNNKKPIIQ